jgi:hypothetical protein
MSYFACQIGPIASWLVLSDEVQIVSVTSVSEIGYSPARTPAPHDCRIVPVGSGLPSRNCATPLMGGSALPQLPGVSGARWGVARRHCSQVSGVSCQVSAWPGGAWRAVIAARTPRRGHKAGWMHRQAGRQTDRQTVRQTESVRQTDRQTDRQTTDDRRTDGQTDYFSDTYCQLQRGAARFLAHPKSPIDSLRSRGATATYPCHLFPYGMII